MPNSHAQNSKITTIIKLGSSKLTYQVPTKWSVNKLKCLLTSEVPSLSFDDFELCSNTELLRGSHKLH